MNSKEKIEYVRNSIQEIVDTSPKGLLHLTLYSVGHPDNEEWTLLTIGEQKRILKKLEEDGEIKNLQFLDKREASFEVLYTEKKSKDIIYEKGRIRSEALELISKEIGNRFSFSKMERVFVMPMKNDTEKLNIVLYKLIK